MLILTTKCVNLQVLILSEQSKIQVGVHTGNLHSIYLESVYKDIDFSKLCIMI